MGDREIEAMSSVATALADLDADARGRVLRWAAERYDVLGISKDTRKGRGADEGPDENESEEKAHAELPAF